MKLPMGMPYGPWFGAPADHPWTSIGDRAWFAGRFCWGMRYGEDDMMPVPDFAYSIFVKAL